ncbi:Uncharacterized protein HZ326_31838 [Fusarium oxysporum f. sp. albedinis]|nr:Uncharacterized protein HZ326_31838 [Fusarium oxysporum f. sp. albedinis]
MTSICVVESIWALKSSSIAVAPAIHGSTDAPESRPCLISIPYYGFLCLTLILRYHITHLVSLINNCNLIIDSTRLDSTTVSDSSW